MLEISDCSNSSNTTQHLPISSNNNGRRLAKNNTSGFRGVYLECGKFWTARIGKRDRYHLIGRFKTAEEAAKAFDRARIAYRPACKNLNFPELREQYMAELERDRVRQLTFPSLG